jgi:ATP-dependent helicase/nuclease subunit A
MINDASLAQIVAARPDTSTWLSANAGSGKTRVLTDRVARLLLGGVQPQNILCLTYTKAAASEMQNRLFKRLGQWSMKPDDDLRKDLADLGEGDGLDASRLALARQLFARAIETPGGLRIQTIHSFCATLLRRYPLEAKVSPGFAEMDDRTARNLRDDIVQEMADSLAPKAVAALARHYTAEDFSALLAEICSRSEELLPAPDHATLCDALGVRAEDSINAVLGDVFLGDEQDFLARIGALLAGSSSKTDRGHAARLAALAPITANLSTMAELEALFLTGAKVTKAAPFSAKIDIYSSQGMRQAFGGDLDRLHKLMRRLEQARPRRLGLEAAAKTAALHAFATPFLSLYARRKEERGFLDFDDLIRKARDLLTDPSLAAWVLFRLDGGIDHVLVDEAQDTSPMQWAVIERLTAEFTAGDSAATRPRTLFVVGDKKQSIYSFQGADLSAFDSKRMEFGGLFAQVGQPMQDRTLDYSFRSSRAVLDVVDATFGAAFPEALGAPPRHLAFFGDLPGRVDFWPLIPGAEKTKDNDGWDPVDLIAEDHHTVELARMIAKRLAAMIDEGVQVPDQKGGFRPLHAGDILILVQTRGPLFAQIIRACKKAGLPIAGADRLKLGEELAVKDLKALLSFLATPEDSLSLAAALRSPLFGWSEDRLYRLAHGRKGHLWEVLRNAEDEPALAILHDLRNQTDFMRPYEILERVLTRHQGRARLLTRLGTEAEDGIDELLTQAMIYEQNDVPSLTGFLIWLEADDVEVKRQPDSQGRNIRVMTVHGAKGLEAPVVILPDTADRRPKERNEIFRLDQGISVWRTASDDSPDQITQARTLAKAKAAQENLRLLYVALTRAQSWLIIAGAGDAKTETKDGPKPRDQWCWYRQIEAGLKSLGAQPTHDGGMQHGYGLWPGSAFAETVLPDPVTLPEWSLHVASPPAKPEVMLKPSDLGGAKALPGEGDETDVAMARGTFLHALLEHMPRTDPSDWPALAAHFAPEGIDPTPVLAEAAGVLADPALAPLFGPASLAEVSITADILGHRMTGAIDRLVVAPDRVLAVDFKSNRAIPKTAHDIPEGLLRQMGAYAMALAQIYPGRRIETAILWTTAPRLMSLDPDIVTLALQRATIP